MDFPPPVLRLLFRDAVGAVEAVREGPQFAAFTHEAFHHADLAHDFGEAAGGDVYLVVLFAFEPLPLHAREAREVQVHGEHEEQEDRERPPVPGADYEHGHSRDHHGNE